MQRQGDMGRSLKYAEDMREVCSRNVNLMYSFVTHYHIETRSFVLETSSCESAGEQ